MVVLPLQLLLHRPGQCICLTLTDDSTPLHHRLACPDMLFSLVRTLQEDAASIDVVAALMMTASSCVAGARDTVAAAVHVIHHDPPHFLSSERPAMSTQSLDLSPGSTAVQYSVKLHQLLQETRVWSEDLGPDAETAWAHAVAEVAATILAASAADDTCTLLTLLTQLLPVIGAEAVRSFPGILNSCSYGAWELTGGRGICRVGRLSHLCVACGGLCFCLCHSCV
jgi:hypothetical protein